MTAQQTPINHEMTINQFCVPLAWQHQQPQLTFPAG
jgi:hypothetical protein